MRVATKKRIKTDVVGGCSVNLIAPTTNPKRRKTMRIIDYAIIASCFITALAFGYVITKDKCNYRNINPQTRRKIHNKASKKRKR